MALEYITIKGTYKGSDGLPEIGYVEFRPNVPLTLSTGGVVIPEPIRAQLDVFGFFTTSLLATNNEDVFPYGWYWVVDEKIQHGNLWYLMPNTPAGGGRDPLDISNVYRPIGATDQAPVVVQPGPAGVKGEQGTVSVEHTETGEPGTEALVIDLDPASTGAVLHFIIPKGEKGDKGDTGTVTGVGLPEIYAQPNEPAELEANVLWVDIDDVAGTSGSAGTAAEIYTQPDKPAPTGSNILWVDTDDNVAIKSSTWLSPDEVVAGSNVIVDKTTIVGSVIISSTGSGGGGGLVLDSVTNLHLANMPANTLKGNNTASTADPADLSTAQVKTLLALTKGDVGLSNVDNTSDASKPVSTAQQTALNLKADTTYVNARTPVIVKSTTAPTDLTAIWMDIN